MSEFSINGAEFYYKGKPIRILSGSIHYFRVVPEYWEDRLLKLKACGFNTVETYIPWNIHEPSEGNYCFEGMADLISFIKLAESINLLVIVRPSPYICAEWEFGGLPSWLLNYPQMRLRCYNKEFLDKLDSYYDNLIPRLMPLLCTNGGPIIAVQIENEYGSYGNDKKYLEHLKQGMIMRGIDVLLFTSDGGTDSMLQGGTLPDVFKTVNFGSKPEEAFAKLMEYQKDMPLMCAEFWCGWFDHWTEKHHTRAAADVADTLEIMLQAGASVNFYMFHGGTNFGFYNGSNCFDKYEPTVTSYDSHALLNEAGEPTDKYYAVQKVLSKYSMPVGEKMPEQKIINVYPKITLDGQVGLLDSLSLLSKPKESVCPEPMEAFGQDYGFIMYETFVTGPRKDNKLYIQDVHDRALVFLNDEFMGVIERWNKSASITLDIPAAGANLSILVENMGRVNYGPHLKDFKGITEGVRLDNQFLFHWTIYTLPLNNLSTLKFGDIVKTNKPVFYKGILNVDKPKDTFISMEGWTKGVVYINGFNLGRYWNVGPQKALFLPGPLLHSGVNEIIVFELHGMKEPVIRFTTDAYV